MEIKRMTRLLRSLAFVCVLLLAALVGYALMEFIRFANVFDRPNLKGK